MQKESELFIKNIQNLPIWVKQVVAQEIYEDIKQKLNDFVELLNGNNLFQYLKPVITLKGKEELQERKLHFAEGYYTFLHDLLEGYSIFDITIKNNWTLADSAKIFIRLQEYEFLSVPNQKSNVNVAVALFISGKIKTGEFLKRIGKIDAIQLEQALRYQKQLNDEGRHIKMASVLIKMGFITDKGLDTVLTLKDEAKRRLTFGVGLTSIQHEDMDDKNDYTERLQKELARLENENLILKKRLKKMLNLD